VKGMTIVRDGNVVHEQVATAMAATKSDKADKTDKKELAA